MTSTFEVGYKWGYYPKASSSFLFIICLSFPNYGGYDKQLHSFNYSLSAKSKFPTLQISTSNLNEETFLLKSPDCIINLGHQPSDNTAFLGKTVVTLNFEDILAYPGSIQKTVTTMWDL